MGKNNGLLLVGGLVAAYFLLNRKDENGQPISIFGGFGSGDAPSGGLLPDFGGLGSGLGNMFSGIGGGFAAPIESVGGLLGGLGEGVARTFEGLSMPIDAGFGGLSALVEALGLQTQGIQDQLNKTLAELGTQTTGVIDATTRTIGQVGQTGVDLASGVKLVGTTALQLGGGYLAFKALSPVAPVAGRTAATALNALRPAVGNAARSVGSVASRLAPYGARALLSPVGKVPVAGTAGAVVLAGAAGYGVGTLFNRTPAGKALIRASGSAGARFAGTSLGHKVFGGARVNTAATDRSFAKVGFTTADIRAMQRSGMSPSQIAAKFKR